VFKANLRRARRHQLLDPSAEHGVTKFSDLTQQEFQEFYLGYRPNDPTSQLHNAASRPTAGDPPSTFDWRSHPGVLTPVYNQEQCGSCWAFSAVENMESQWALAGYNLTSLSVQQVVDCDTTDGGCNGGDTPTAYEYIQKAGGLESWKEYPYTAKNGRCRFDKSGVVAQITGWEYAGKNDEAKMADYLATHGPVSICVDASNWNNYKKGILPASKCGNQLDHCVLAVGYDLDSKYWIVRNSWGTDWGVEDGFIYLEYGTNTCGLATEPTSSTV